MCEKILCDIPENMITIEMCKEVVESVKKDYNVLIKEQGKETLVKSIEEVVKDGEKLDEELFKLQSDRVDIPEKNE